MDVDTLVAQWFSSSHVRLSLSPSQFTEVVVGHWFVSSNIIAININKGYRDILMFRWGRVYAISHHESSYYFKFP